MKLKLTGVAPSILLPLLAALLWGSRFSLAVEAASTTVPWGPDLIVEDQCATFRTNLGSDLKNMLKLPWMPESKDVDMCLCTTTITSFMHDGKNKEVEIAVAMVGEAKVRKALEQLIEKNRPLLCPILPSHAKRVCNGAGRKRNVCDITCESPFRKASNGLRCVLSPSASPKPKKRTFDEEVAKAATKCRPGEMVCGRSMHSSMNPSGSFGCLDVSKDLFNCGGCAAGALGVPGEVQGVDCSVIHGVSDVQCLAGNCHVTRCAQGWHVNDSGQGCIPIRY